MEKFAFITGASSGLGRATALQFVKAGYRVLAGVRREVDGLDLQHEEPRIVPVLIDLADPAAIAAAVDDIERRVGPNGLAALVNNAGEIFYWPIEHAPREDVDRLFEVTLFGPVQLTNGLLPAMRRYAEAGRQRARVLNVISWASLEANPWVGYYAAAKAAFLRLTQAQLYEFDRYGIDAIAIVPGMMKTPFVGQAPQAIAETIERLSPEALRVYGRHLQRLASLSTTAPTNPIVARPEAVARRIAAIAASPRVRYQYNLGIDTALVAFMSRAVPFFLQRRLRVAMFGLNS